MVVVFDCLTFTCESLSTATSHGPRTHRVNTCVCCLGSFPWSPAGSGFHVAFTIVSNNRSIEGSSQESPWQLVIGKDLWRCHWATPPPPPEMGPLQECGGGGATDSSKDRPHRWGKWVDRRGRGGTRVRRSAGALMASMDFSFARLGPSSGRVAGTRKVWLCRGL